MEEKERYLDRLDNQFGALVKQIIKYDESKYDILTLIDPQILTKFDLVKANIEVCKHIYVFMYQFYDICGFETEGFFLLFRYLAGTINLTMTLNFSVA